MTCRRRNQISQMHHFSLILTKAECKKYQVHQGFAEWRKPSKLMRSFQKCSKYRSAPQSQLRSLQLDGNNNKIKIEPKEKVEIWNWKEGWDRVTAFGRVGNSSRRLQSVEKVFLKYVFNRHIMHNILNIPLYNFWNAYRMCLDCFL